MRDKVTRCDRPLIKSGRIPERKWGGQGAHVQEAALGTHETHFSAGTREHSSRGGQRSRFGTPTRALAGSIRIGMEAPAFERISSVL